MKLTKENFELIMFDLLEGNLSQKDAIQVMGQIEGDEFFFREWKLLKATVLVDDKEVVYANKASLLKEEEKVVVLWHKWVAVASAACLIGVAVLLWPRADVGEVVVTPKPILDNTEVATIDQNRVDEITEAENKIIPVVSPKKAVAQKTQHIVVHPFNRIILNDDNGSEKQIVEDIALPEPKLAQNAKEKLKESQDIPQKNINEPELTPVIANFDKNKTTNNQPFTSNNPSFIKKVVTNHPKDRISDRISSVIALIRNPKVKFQPEFQNKRPSLNILVDTDGYEAVASIQPFNNTK